MAKRPLSRKAPGVAKGAPASPPRQPRSRLPRAIQRVSWVYLVVIGIIWAMLRFGGDRWWPATLMLFGPTWITVLPGAMLISIALIFRRRSLGILLVASAVALFELGGLCIPWRTWFAGPAAGPVIRLMTCNTNGRHLDEDALSQVIDDTNPDVILLQEWPLARTTPPRFQGAWHFQRDGELVIASRFPIVKSADFDFVNPSEWGGAAIRYDLDAPGGLLHLFNLHLASPHMPFLQVIGGMPSGTARLTMHLAVRREQSEKLSDAIANTGNGVLAAGDFNTLCQGSIYHEFWSHFADAFSAAGLGYGHTYFAEGAAVRIDHVMTGSGWKCRRCWVEKSVGSPHRPVIADLER